MVLSKLRTYKVFLLSNSLLNFSTGLLYPFWLAFLQNFSGSIEQFGFSIGLMAFSAAIASYYAGKHSDNLGRKPFLIVSGFMFGVMLIAYTFITSLMQLYVLQIITGITTAMYMTMEAAFLGDVTKKESRGRDIGKYHALVGVMAAVATMGGGFVVGSLGFKVIFYITASLVFVSTLMLFYIKEKSIISMKLSKKNKHKSQ